MKNRQRTVHLFVAMALIFETLVSITGVVPASSVAPSAWATQSAQTTTGIWSGVAYGNGTFVAVSSTGSIMTSSDNGVTWILRTGPTGYETAAWKGIAFGNGRFIAIKGTRNVTNNAMYSTDNGASWNISTTPASEGNSRSTSSFPTNYQSITFSTVGGVNQFLAVSVLGVNYNGGNTNNSFHVIASSDGITWTAKDVGFDTTWGAIGCSSSSCMVLNGQNNGTNTGWLNSSYSTDGSAWTYISSFPAGPFTSIAYGNGTYVALGSRNWTEAVGSMRYVGNVIYNNSSPQTASNWIKGSSSNVPQNYWNSVVYGGDSFVAVSNDGKVMSSQNGINWALYEGVPVSTWQSIAYGNSTYVAVGGTNSVITSVVAAAPSAATIGTVTRTDNTTISLPFTAGASNGSAITSYTITSSPSISLTYSGTTSPFTVTGSFVQGQAYTFTMTATNGIGTSSPSSSSNAVTVNPYVYSITYNYDDATSGNSNLSENYTQGSPALTLPTPSKQGYVFSGWYSDSGLATLIGQAGGSYTPSGATTTLNVYAKWSINTYAITVTQTPNGTITPLSATVNYGSNQLFTFTPATGYSVASITVDGTALSSSDLASAISSGYTFSNVIAIHTVTALFSVNSYAITFDANGGSGGSIPSIAYNSNALASAPTVSRADYSFAGWSESASGVVISSWTVIGIKTLYAIWTPAFVVSFTSNGSAVVSLTYTTTALSKPADPTRDGYTFVEWRNPSNAAITWPYKPTASIALTAGWSIKTYAITITQSSNGSISPTSATVDYGSSQTFIFSPATGYSVASITVDGTALSLSAITTAVTSGYTFINVSATHSITATYSLTSYTITFDSNGATGGTTPSVAYGANALASAPTLTRTDYSFAGWSETTSGEVIALWNVIGNKSLYAIWTPAFVVSFTSAGSAVASLTYTTTALSKPADPTRDGYSFANWKDASSNLIIWPYTPTASIALIAHWTADDLNSDLVAYWNFDNGSILGNSTYGNFNLTNSGTPSYADSGKNGRGLYLNGSSYLSATSYSTALQGNARYTIAAWYKSSFSNNGGFIGYGPPGCGRTNNLRLDRSRGFWNYWWDCDAGPASAPANYLNGQWHHIAVAYDGVNTTFYFDGVSVGSVANSSRVPGQTTPNFVDGPFYLGQTIGDSAFNGLLDDVSLYSRSLSLSEIQSLMNGALNTSIYTLTYDYNGASGGNSVVTENYAVTGSKATLPNPTKSGFVFNGWHSNSELTALIGLGSATYSVTSSVTVFAKWAIDTSNAIIYNNGSATTAQSGGSTTYTTDAAVTTIPTTAPLKTGYTFIGWFTLASGGTQVTSGTYTPVSPYGAITLYAHWSINSYTVTFSANGGSGGSTASVTYGINAVASAPTVTRDNHDFIGWSEGVSGSVITTWVVVDAKTLYAIWTVRSYVLTFLPNLGTVSTPTVEVNVGSATLLPTPTRLNFQFNGWIDSAAPSILIGTAGQSYTPTSNKSMTAKWTQNSLIGLGSAEIINTMKVSSNASIGTIFQASNDTSNVSITYKAGALPAGTVVDLYFITDVSRFNSAITSAKDFIVTLALAWLAPDGTVPTTAVGKAFSMTIANATIKAGAKAYALNGDEIKVVGTALVDGSITLLITDDPLITVAAVVPDVPTGISATNGADSSSVVSWTAPTSNGGSTIIGYTVTANTGQTCATLTTTCTYTNLTNGTAYTFSVTATNSIGTSASSSISSSITPVVDAATLADAQAAAAKIIADAEAAATKVIADAKALADAKDAADAAAAKVITDAAAAKVIADAAAAKVIADAAAAKVIADAAAASAQGSGGGGGGGGGAPAPDQSATDKDIADAKAASDKAIADAKAKADKAIADAKAAADVAASEAKAIADKAIADAAAEAKAVADKIANDRAVAEAKAAADKAAADKAAADKAAADKAAADKAALLAANKKPVFTSVFFAPRTWKLDSVDTKIVNAVKPLLKSGSVVTCTAYTSGNNPTARGKNLAKAQASTTCLAIVKGNKKVSYQVKVLPGKSAPKSSMAQGKSQSFRVDILVGKSS